MREQELLAKFNVTAEQVDDWAAEYENTDWTHMKFGQVRIGRPPLTNEDLISVTVKIPESRATALDRIQAQTGLTKSEFIRRAIDHELIRQAVKEEEAPMSQPVNEQQIRDLREKIAECFTGAEFACRREPLHEIKLNVEVTQDESWRIHVANQNFSTMMEIINHIKTGAAAAEFYFPESVEEAKVNATALFLITNRNDPAPGRHWEIQFSHQEDTEDPILRLDLPCFHGGWYRVRIVRQALNQVGEPVGDEETYEYDLR